MVIQCGTAFVDHKCIYRSSKAVYLMWVSRVHSFDWVVHIPVQIFLLLCLCLEGVGVGVHLFTEDIAGSRLVELNIEQVGHIVIAVCLGPGSVCMALAVGGILNGIGALGVGDRARFRLNRFVLWRNKVGHRFCLDGCRL